MKKLLPVFLALSLLANAAFILTKIRSGTSLSLASAAAEARASSKPGAKKADPAALIPNSSDLAAIYDHLVAAGIKPGDAREVVQAILWKPYLDRQRAIYASKSDRPYWQQVPGNHKRPTSEERAELRALSEQIEMRSAEVLGASAAPGRASTADRLSFLPPEKAAAIARLNRDYGELHDGVSDESSLFKLPSDDASKKLLRQEQRRDLEAILSPEELADYDRRFSYSANELRKHFSSLPDSTEAEYLAAYDITQSMTAGKNDAAAQAAAAEQLRALLGPERYATFQRASDSDYAALQGAAARFDLSPATVEQVYNLRDQAVALSQQIASNTSLSAKEKQQALKALANQTRNDVRNNLGDEVGNAYLDKNMTWLKSLADGNPVSLTATGKVVSKGSGKNVAADKNAKAGKNKPDKKK